MSMTSVRSEPLPPTLVLFALGPRSRAAADGIARELRAARVDVRDLRAACRALEATRPMFLLASTAVKTWDREVVEEHAAKGSVPVRSIPPDDFHLVDGAVRAWIVKALRPALR